MVVPLILSLSAVLLNMVDSQVLEALGSQVKDLDMEHVIQHRINILSILNNQDPGWVSEWVEDLTHHPLAMMKK